jgi:aryl-alcohol dehydrogenase-like predicted oxidoreductase
MKLALGTVQFGLDYGSINANGQVDRNEVGAILELAQAAGIDTLDTARTYGTSEELLGSLKAMERFRVVTKIAPLGQTINKDESLAESLSRSQAALRANRLDAALFHSADDLLADDATRTWSAAERACADGQIGQLGVSVYDAEQALAIAERFPIALVQLPVSIFDQRALASGALNRLQARGIEIHARSVFLQGFALSDPDSLPPGLARFKPELSAFRTFASRQGASPLVASLSFVLAQTCIDRVVVGVQSAKEMRDICSVNDQPIDLVGAADIASSNLQLLNPSLWATKGE